MKKLLSYLFQSLLTAVMVVMFTSCEDINVNNEGMPYAISDCADQYFQGRGISSFRELDNGNYEFTVNNGPTIIIDIISNNELNVQYDLISYKGDGESMPVNMAFDKLPETLYNYISGVESLNDIYDMVRVDNVIYITLLDTKLEYDIHTGTITES